MIHILHISDLHFVNNTTSYNMEEILLKEAAKKVKDVPLGKKLLIITGDLHNFWDQDYKKVENFLQKLVSKMGLDMAQDVFVIPGNHDVGNEAALKPFLEPKDRFWKNHQKSCLSMLKNGDKGFMEERLQVFAPYSAFVRKLGIYDASSSDDYPARSHVRCWRGKLNILHLNTALIADGMSKTEQITDADMAASPETWKDYFDSTVPSLAIGHNDFFDLEKLQRTDLAGVFNLRNVSAYLCGDRHRTEKDPEHQMIRLVSGHRQGIEIPNLVAARSIADGDDDYSAVGFCWHCWNEDTDDVTVEFRKWTRENLAETVPDGLKSEYVMRREKPGQSGPDDIKKDITNEPPSEKGAGYEALRKYLDDVMEQRRKRNSSSQRLTQDEIDSLVYPYPEIEEVKPPSPFGTAAIIPQDIHDAEKHKQFDLEKELEKIVGLETVKDLVREQYRICTAKEILRKANIKTDTNQSLNMVFTGNPGTGKTFVARIIAHVYKEMGVLKKGQLVTTCGVRLISQYIGQTAKKTEEVFRSAIGGVLFIDEAYGIFNSDRFSGLECLDTLIKLIQVHNDEIIVILAGYTKEINEFMEVNPGFMVRFPIRIEFPDYSAEELFEIGKLQIENDGFILSETAESVFLDAIKTLKNHSQPNSGNAYIVINLLNEIIRRQFARIATTKVNNDEVNFILPEDIRTVEITESTSYSNATLDTSSEMFPTDKLMEELADCIAGKKGAYKFEEICFKTLRYVFSDDLSLWSKQTNSNKDLYRFDLLCRINDNTGKTVWSMLERYFNSKYLVFEFKNYNEEITQKEIYTTEKYLYSKALRKVAVIIARNGFSENAKWAAKGCLREENKLIILLTVEDLIKMYELKKKQKDPTDVLLCAIDELLAHLEK